MNKFLVTAVLAIGLLTSACAQAEYKNSLVEFLDDSEQAVITSVVPNFKQVVTKTPQNVCTTKYLPVYETVQGQGASGLEVLGGAIVGGLLGKGVTKKDEGAIVGGLIGGAVVAEAGRSNKTRIVGYQNQEVCKLHYYDRVESVVSDYTIYYKWNNYYGSSVVNKKYNIGDSVRIMVSLSLVN